MRLLVVEDEDELRQQLVAYLSKEGFIVESAADGKEAAFLGKEYPYDLAVIDIGLPQLSGVEVIKLLRQQNRNFPVLILTARGHWQALTYI